MGEGRFSLYGGEIGEAKRLFGILQSVFKNWQPETAFWLREPAQVVRGHKTGTLQEVLRSAGLVVEIGEEGPGGDWKARAGAGQGRAERRIDTKAHENMQRMIFDCEMDITLLI